MANWAERGAAARVVPAEPVVLAGPAGLAVRAGPAGQCLARMADAFANSIMVDALILGREGTTIPDLNSYAPALPPTSMTRDKWNAGSRGFAPTSAVGEMLQGISFQRRRPAG